MALPAALALARVNWDGDASIVAARVAVGGAGKEKHRCNPLGRIEAWQMLSIKGGPFSLLLPPVHSWPRSTLNGSSRPALARKSSHQGVLQTTHFQQEVRREKAAAYGAWRRFLGTRCFLCKTPQRDVGFGFSRGPLQENGGATVTAAAPSCRSRT